MTIHKSLLIQKVLRDLQIDIEASRVSEESKKRQRSVLRGFRVGFWAVAERSSMQDIEQTLREELGFPVHANCASGTDSEV
ncbi:hypothetical protein [Pseudomonas sp. P9_31]|uniref:hypothetical protein n=1 Tax=Pseudomonas sp. P9_31 TaxID=3043448 RepID=UPI002A3721F0|nr:hypothetical protein [Pseudomonas sp. P9_31]WPN59743.1 hypothetical protein QMK51_09115 [Pseudomonas sp. P9_31]